MAILNLAGYKFTPLTELEHWQKKFLNVCQMHALKGTILLSTEGININLSGACAEVELFRDSLLNDPRFNDMILHQSYSATVPFKRLKVKIKSEIISLRQAKIDVTKQRAPSICPTTFKQWLDNEKEMTVLDTRNDYEVRFGAFKNAEHLHIDDFCKLPTALENIAKDKPLVMYCTGGIRCEKAAVYLLNEGFKDVYQLEGGILGYFEKVGGAHYEGDCFVFDERVALNPAKKPSDRKQCKQCEGPMTEPFHPQFICPDCVSTLSHN